MYSFHIPKKVSITFYHLFHYKVYYSNWLISTLLRASVNVLFCTAKSFLQYKLQTSRYFTYVRQFLKLREFQKWRIFEMGDFWLKYAELWNNIGKWDNFENWENFVNWEIFISRGIFVAWEIFDLLPPETFFLYSSLFWNETYSARFFYCKTFCLTNYSRAKKN